MCLTGILKNILLVIASVAIWRTTITPVQFVGYSIACFGLVYYSLGWEQMVAQSAAGWAYAKNVWDGPSSGEKARSINGVSISSHLRRAFLVLLALLAVGLLWLGLAPRSDEGVKSRP